jgi:hypothetical protein
MIHTADTFVTVVLAAFIAVTSAAAILKMLIRRRIEVHSQISGLPRPIRDWMMGEGPRSSRLSFGWALAFSTAAILYFALAATTYFVQTPLRQSGRWQGGPIWFEVAIGVALMLPATFCWRRALRLSSTTTSR